MRWKFAATAVALIGPAAGGCAPSRPGTTGYVIETIAGNDGAGDGGPALSAQLTDAQGIAVDPAGNLYIADTDHHRVRKVNPAGIITTVAGTGYAGFSGDGGPGTASQLNLPYGLAADAAGNLYIADFGNNRVRRIAPDGTITTYAGTGVKGPPGDGGPAADAVLMSPRNIVLDAGGNLYVSEFEGHRVRKVSPSGIIATVAGTGVAGLRGDGGPATAAQLAFPAGLALDPAGALYIADTRNQRVRKVLAGGVITTALGAPGTESLYTPIGIAVDNSGALLLAERSAWVRRFPATGTPTVVAGTGTAGFDGDGKPATTARISLPADIAVDRGGALYIADRNHIRKVTPAGIMTTVAGDGYLHNVGDNGPATAALLSRPAGLSMDVQGNIYVADSGTHRVRRVAAGVITTVAGNGGAAFGGDGGPAASASLNGPAGVYTDPFGTVWIADTGNSRVRAAAGGKIGTSAGSDDRGFGADGDPAWKVPLNGPLAVLGDGRGNLYISDSGNHRVLRKDAAGIVTTVAGNGSAGYGGDGGPGVQAQLHEPTGLALDAAGNLYIADALNNCIRKLSALTGVLETVAGTGAAGFSGDGGPAVQAELFRPRSVAVDGNGNLYVTDTGNHRVRQVMADGSIRSIAGSDAPGFSGDGGSAIAANLNGPWGLLMDGAGNLYFSDMYNHRVRKLSPAAEVAAPEKQVAALSVVNAASRREGPVAGGEIVDLMAAGLPAGDVFFGSLRAAVITAEPGRIRALVPDGVTGDTVKVEVRGSDSVIAAAEVALAPAAPGIFTASGGTGPAAALNQDGKLNSAENPAPRGSIIALFATGMGTKGLPVTATMGGAPTDVLYAGPAPGFPGMTQVNVQLPAGFLPPGTLEVLLRAGPFSSQPGVTVAIR